MITLKTSVAIFEIQTQALADIALEAGVVKSRGEFKRLLAAGGIYWNGTRLKRDSLIWGTRKFCWNNSEAEREAPVFRML